MTTIEDRITIRRPVAQVFAFYRDFSNMPKFLGDVMAIDRIDGTGFRWTIQGPLGIRVRWTMRVTEVRENELIRYETEGTPGLTGRWAISFAPVDGDTEVWSAMTIPLGAIGRGALALIGKYPVKEQTANLHRLKEVIETGRVTDTSYAVAGKFG